MWSSERGEAGLCSRRSGHGTARSLASQAAAGGPAAAGLEGPADAAGGAEQDADAAHDHDEEAPGEEHAADAPEGAHAHGEDAHAEGGGAHLAHGWAARRASPRAAASQSGFEKAPQSGKVQAPSPKKEKGKGKGKAYFAETDSYNRDIESNTTRSGKGRLARPGINVNGDEMFTLRAEPQSRYMITSGNRAKKIGEIRKVDQKVGGRNLAVNIAHTHGVQRAAQGRPQGGPPAYA